MVETMRLESTPTPGMSPPNTEPPEYEYAALPDTNTHIRRLLLDPGRPDDPLSGSLANSELQGGPPYEAISYVWGSDVKDALILIDGRHMSITMNLKKALVLARHRDKRRSLWADSICINQNDRVEKGHQVFLMGRIYETSRCTLICLTDLHDQIPRRENRSHLATLIRDVNDMMDKVVQNLNGPGAVRTNDFPYPSQKDRLVSPERWELWDKLGDCAWCRRGWVLQEATLAREAFVLGITDDGILWSSVVRTQFWAHRRSSLIPDSVTSPILVYPLVTPWIIKNKREVEILRHDRTLSHNTTLGLFSAVRDLQLSNPKDRIYAFMAMPTSDGLMARMQLQPDYSDSTSHLDVYRDFAFKYLHIQNRPDLDLLSCVEHGGGDDGRHEDDETDALGTPAFPSWVPRWDRGRGAPRWFDLRHNPRYSKTEREVPAIHDGSILRVRAIIIDSVPFVASRIEWDTSDGPDAVREVVASWKEIAPKSIKHDPDLHKSPFHRANAFLDTLCRGSYRDGSFNRSQTVFAHLLGDDQPISPIDYSQNLDAQRISTQVIRRSRSLRPILLGRGYFGAASQATRQGDKCAIIFGTRSPFILREVPGKKDHYQVVGAAWIHSKVCSPIGFHYRLGEDDKCNDWEEWGLSSQEISLC